MPDTALWVPIEKLDRLPAAYRHGDHGLVETEPAGAGFYAEPPPFDVSHGALVSTVRDFHRFARMLADASRIGGESMISSDHLRQMTSDQVPAENKGPDSFFPRFWDAMGWGSASACRPRDPAAAAMAGPAARARTSSSTRTGQSASSSPRSS